MHRVALIIPNWLGAHGESVLRQSLPALHSFAERSKLQKLTPNNPTKTPEAAWLGIDPNSIDLNDGPLIVSAFGYDPPARSVQFQLSLLSIQDGIATKPKQKIPEEDLSAIWLASEKLNTKNLTAVKGEGTEHGLVWEDGSLDMQSTPAAEVGGKPIAGSLPEGDGEKVLRRFIDDSINLLSELELNRVRIEEGHEPLNLWWPWGQGFRTPTPNLALRRGDVCRVVSASIRLQGLTRLCGYRHADRSALRSGLRTDLEYLMSCIASDSATIALIDVFGELQTHNRHEEMDWFTKELDRRLFTPLWDLTLQERLTMALLAPDAGGGLALAYSSGATAANSVPFDERALDERSIGREETWRLMDQALSA
jgi:2,3-bisphosphoglycerate-independent phosphoglycerate mutase